MNLNEAEFIQLQKGDLLVMFTDGVSEAKNDADEEYSEERLERLVIKEASLAAKEMVAEILEDVHRFVRGFSQSDDITLVGMKYE